MPYNTGKLLTILILAVVLTCIASWVLALRYRSAMRRLMSLPLAGGAVDAATGTPPVELLPSAAPVTFADNRRAGLHLGLVLIGLSLLIAATSAVIWMKLAFPGEPLLPKRVAAVALLHAWPVIPALGLMWRWSRLRLLGAMAIWCVFCFLILLWRSMEPRPLELMTAMASEIGPTFVLVTLIMLGNATRAAAPWLLIPFVGLVWASMIGIDILALLVERQSPLLHWLAPWLTAYGAMALFALLPWLIAWWPLLQLGRALARAYSRKWFSDLMVVFTMVWAFSLLEKALGAAGSAGLAAMAMFLPLLWIPPVMLAYGKLQRRAGRPPTLLVLRVFQHDAAVQDLFDQVIERWRLSGNTVMIAGTDLADRTLDAPDIFDFIQGKLATRFIRSAAELAPRIAAMDSLPDADGRYRVSEYYCHDTTWQQALHALVERCDVVLMDLRGFKAHNAGCLYELAALAQAARPLHVVVLHDATTERVAADAAIAGKAQRFVWIDASRINAQRRREVLARLFDYHRAAAAVPDAAAQPMG